MVFPRATRDHGTDLSGHAATARVSQLWEPIVFPEHAFLMVEDGYGCRRRRASGCPLDELALRVLIAAEKYVTHLGD
jgi:hypothetical protein